MQVALHFDNIVKDPGRGVLLLTTAAGCTSIIVLFKYWFKNSKNGCKPKKKK
jgi:hypothetical protein